MSRDHARVYLAIWDDPQWLALTSVQQIGYLALVSSRDLSYCGVAPLIPARYQDLSSDMTSRKFSAAIEGLESARFVVTDRSTAEVLVRSYVRHDGILKQPNVTKALVKALRLVHSDPLRAVVIDELARFYGERPGEKGWKGFADLDPEGFADIQAKASRKGSAKGSGNPKAKVAPTPLPPSPFPTRSGPPSSFNVTSVTRETGVGR